MEEYIKIGNYTIRESKDHTFVDYHKSIKDWILIIITGGFGLLMLTFVFLYFKKNVPDFFRTQDYATMVVPLLGAAIVIMLFMATGFFSLSYSITRLFEPTKCLFQADKINRTFTALLPFYRKRIFSFEEIINFNLYGDTLIYENSENGHKNLSYSCNLHIKTNNSEEKIHEFNPDTVIRSSYDNSDEKERKEISHIGKKITKLIAQECDSHYKWFNYPNKRRK